jgi:hypothetical protein
MVVPALVLFVSAVAIYHSLPTLLGSTKMGLAPVQPTTNIIVSKPTETQEEELQG